MRRNLAMNSKGKETGMRRIVLGLMLPVALYGGDLAAHYFVNRLNYEILLYPASRPNRVIALQPRECVRADRRELYTIVFYAHTNPAEGADAVSRYRTPGSRCTLIAGQKMQCTNFLTLPAAGTGGIWLNGSTVESGLIEDFVEEEECLGEIRST